MGMETLTGMAICLLGNGYAYKGGYFSEWESIRLQGGTGRGAILIEGNGYSYSGGNFAGQFCLRGIDTLTGVVILLNMNGFA